MLESHRYFAINFDRKKRRSFDLVLIKIECERGLLSAVSNSDRIGRIDSVKVHDRIDLVFFLAPEIFGEFPFRGDDGNVPASTVDCMLRSLFESPESKVLSGIARRNSHSSLQTTFPFTAFDSAFTVFVR